MLLSAPNIPSTVSLVVDVCRCEIEELDHKLSLEVVCEIHGARAAKRELYKARGKISRRG